MKYFFYPLVYIPATLFLACSSNATSATEKNKDMALSEPVTGGVNIIYRLGEKERELNPKTLRVSIITETVENDKGETKNSALTMTLHDLENHMSIRIYFKDEKVTDFFNGNYPIRFARGFEEDESIRSVTFSFIDTNNTNDSYYNEDGGTCHISMNATTLTLATENGRVKNPKSEKNSSFSVHIEARSIEIKRK